MLEANFTITGAELSAELLEKIKQLFQGKGQDFVVQISVKPKETAEAANRRIEKAIDQIEAGEKLIAFAPEEYNALFAKLAQPQA